jgi:hypothetical protein
MPLFHHMSLNLISKSTQNGARVLRKLPVRLEFPLWDGNVFVSSRWMTSQPSNDSLIVIKTSINVKDVIIWQAQRQSSILGSFLVFRPYPPRAAGIKGTSSSLSDSILHPQVIQIPCKH